MLRLHFGLGEADKINKVEIAWPGGETSVREDVKANQLLTIRRRQ